MRCAGLAALCAAVSLSGIYFVFRRKKKIAVLEKFSLFFLQLAEIVSLFGFDILKTFEKIGAMQRFSDFNFLKILSDSQTNVSERWSKAVLCSEDTAFLDNGQTEVLAGFYEGLGRSSLDSFLMRCRDYAKIFSDFAENEKEQAARTEKLLIYSGFLAGAALFVIAV